MSGARRIVFSALLVIVALVVAATSHVRISFYQRQSDARERELQQLRELGLSVETRKSSLAWIAGTYRKEDQLSELLKRNLGGVKNDLVLRGSTAAGEGWTIRQYDLRIESVPAAQFGAFLAACANARPPVRVNDLQVSSASRTGDTLAAQLALAELSSASLGSPP